MDRFPSLWRYGRITGLWMHVKELTGNAEQNEQWLAIFARDEPQYDFKIQRNRPSKKPKVAI